MMKEIGIIPNARNILELSLKQMSGREEIQAIANLNVYLTPCGGGSMSAFLLPNGATAIIGKPDVSFQLGLTLTFSAYYR